MVIVERFGETSIRWDDLPWLISHPSAVKSVSSSENLISGGNRRSLSRILSAFGIAALSAGSTIRRPPERIIIRHSEMLSRKLSYRSGVRLEPHPASVSLSLIHISEPHETV